MHSSVSSFICSTNVHGAVLGPVLGTGNMMVPRNQSTGEGSQTFTVWSVPSRKEREGSTAKAREEEGWESCALGQRASG